MKIPWDFISAILVAVIGSTWFTNWMNNRSKYSNKALMKRMDDMETAEEIRDANDARRRILNFDGELRREVPHTEEQFNNVLEDIDFYKRYCQDHPKYQNTKAVAAIGHTEEVYADHLKDNDFLK